MKKTLLFLTLLLSTAGAFAASTMTFETGTSSLMQPSSGNIFFPGGIIATGGSTFIGPVKYRFVTVSATTIDWAISTSFFKQISANTTIAFTGVANDGDCTIVIQQDATGGRTLTWSSSATWINSTNQTAIPAVNPAPNSYSKYHFFQRAGTLYAEGPSTSPSKFSVDLDSATATVLDLQNQLANGATLATTDTAQTFVGKDISAANNTIRMTNYLILAQPQLSDGVGAILQTNNSASPLFGQAKFANGAAASANYIEYRFIVPFDLDTAFDLKVESFKFILGGVDTGTHRYIISMQSVADSASYTGTPGNAVNIDFIGGDPSGANNDVNTISNIPVTLTSWRSNLTRGQLWVIRLARDGNNAADNSTVDSYSGPLVISYVLVQ